MSFCPSSFLYIAENKVVAGQEKKADDVDAVFGRKLAIVFSRGRQQIRPRSDECTARPSTCARTS